MAFVRQVIKQNWLNLLYQGSINFKKLNLLDIYLFKTTHVFFNFLFDILR
jgi:hypothetical protein